LSLGGVWGLGGLYSVCGMGGGCVFLKVCYCRLGGLWDGARGGLIVVLLMCMLGRVLPLLVLRFLTRAGRVLIRVLLSVKLVNSDVKDNLCEPIYRQGNWNF